MQEGGSAPTDLGDNDFFLDSITAGWNGKRVRSRFVGEYVWGKKDSKPLKTYVSSYLQGSTRLVLVLDIIPMPLCCFKQISNPHATSQHVQSALLSFAHLIITKQRVFDRADSASVTYGVIYLVVLGEGGNCG